MSSAIQPHITLQTNAVTKRNAPTPYGTTSSTQKYMNKPQSGAHPKAINHNRLTVSLLMQTSSLPPRGIKPRHYPTRKERTRSATLTRWSAEKQTTACRLPDPQELRLTVSCRHGCTFWPSPLWWGQNVPATRKGCEVLRRHQCSEGKYRVQCSPSYAAQIST
jgi:hypothetical protein